MKVRFAVFLVHFGFDQSLCIFLTCQGVWFGCDVGQHYDGKEGLNDLELLVPLTNYCIAGKFGGKFNLVV